MTTGRKGAAAIAKTNDTADNPTILRFDRREVAGALGDLGVFIPLFVGMVNRCGLQLGPTLLLTGLMNVITGLVFRIPMPVQPMKLIAAVAIAEGLSESQILCAGIITGGFVLLLGVTGLINWLNSVIPKSVIRGLQLALGLKLLTGGLGMITGTGLWFGWDSIGLGIACALLVLWLYHSARVPGALVVFVIGLIALIAADRTILSRTSLGMDWHWPDFSNREDWEVGLVQGAIQLPMTLLNSVIAICALSVDLFPKRPAAPRRVAISLGLMNLIGCPFGAMPVCHGAGGLAAQYRFGARTGGSMVLLGCAKIVLALLFGGSILTWLLAYPESVLGVLLLFSGLELAMVCRDQRARGDFFVMMVTAGVCMAVNTALGFAVGIVIAMLLLRGVFHIEPPTKGTRPTQGTVTRDQMEPTEPSRDR